MSVLSTYKSMKQDGWKFTTINGIKCLKLEDNGYTLIAERSESGFMDPISLVSITNKLGKPHRINTLNDSITTVEY